MIPKADRKDLAQSLALTEQEINIVRAPDKVKIRSAAAKAILPGTPEQTLKMLTAVAMAAPEAEIRELATQSAANLPETTTLPYAEKGESEGILWFIYQAIADKKVRQKLYVNRHVPIALLVQASKDETDSDLLELLAGNQAKMVENAEFPGHLLENTNLPAVARSRVEEFFARTFATGILQQTGAEIDEDFHGEATEELPEGAADLSEMPEEFTEHKSEEEDEEAMQETLDKLKYQSEDDEEEEEEVTSLFGRVSNMSIAQKIKLAILGNLEARKLLIKEANRLIQESVMKNPRITDSEVQAIAMNKQTSQDILRMIVSNRTWMRKYSMKLALVSNPKFPFANAVTLMNQLRDNDLKGLAKSKAVPANISKQAKILLQKRG